MLTNWRTISNSIRRLKELETKVSEESTGLTKKELLNLNRERDKLERALGGIKEMAGLPDIMFVIDTNKEAIAVAEANKLGIPVVGIIDSNSDPSGINYPIPGNDDALRAVILYCELMADAVLDGIQQEMTAAGVDVGALEDIHEPALQEIEDDGDVVSEPDNSVESPTPGTAEAGMGQDDAAPDAAGDNVN